MCWSLRVGARCERVLVKHVIIASLAFHFDNDEMTKMLGHELNIIGEKLDVVQSGSRNWSGEVFVSGVISDISEKILYIGKQSPENNITSGQWSAGDEIRLQSCVGRYW